MRSIIKYSLGMCFYPLKAYERKCAVTNESITESLEAAHIIPYK